MIEMASRIYAISVIERCSTQIPNSPIPLYAGVKDPRSPQNPGGFGSPGARLRRRYASSTPLERHAFGPGLRQCSRHETASEARMCKVLNKHATGEQAGAIYIGRGSKWGNPFRIGNDGNRATVIAKHDIWLRDQHHLLRALDELRGRDLLCFCAPTPCHGDLLLRLANASRAERVSWWRSPA